MSVTVNNAEHVALRERALRLDLTRGKPSPGQLDLMAFAGDDDYKAADTGARVVALAGPSEILVSRTIRALVAGAPIRLESRGVHQLKGVPGPWEVFAVIS